MIGMTIAIAVIAAIVLGVTMQSMAALESQD
jgi:hypothetical protein